MVFESDIFLSFSIINTSCGASFSLNYPTMRTPQVAGSVFINFLNDPVPKFPQKTQS